MSCEDVYDVTIVGGGPTGLYTAFYSGMRDLRTKVIEAQPYLGGKLHAYPEKVVWDIGGLPPTAGEDVIRYVVEQGTTFDPTVALGEKVVSVDREDGVFRVGTEGGEEHLSRTVVLAMGHGILDPQRLEIEGAERFEVSNLHYTVTSLEKFRGKRVMISGGGNTAVDWANAIEPLAESVAVVHRREEFAGHESAVARMRQSTVEVFTPYSLSELRADDDGEEIKAVTLTHTVTGETHDLEVDAVVVNHGYNIDLGFLKGGSFPMKDDCLVVNESMETSVPGIYAAGDIVTYDGRLHLISGGFVEGATAVNSAKLYLEPGADASAYVSSHNERFAEKNRELELQGAIDGR